MEHYLTDVDISLGKHSALRRLYIGAGLLLVGALLVAFGGIVLGTRTAVDVGLPAPFALKVSVATAAVFVPSVFGGILLQIPAAVRHQGFGMSGVSFAAGGIAVYWVTVPPDGLGGPVFPLLPPALMYGTGLIVAVLSPILAATDAIIDGPEPVPELAGADWDEW